jgi:DNA-binding SARP family transcriptional activator
MGAAAILRRERVDRALAPIWDRRLGLVVAPAGAGKTTSARLLAASSAHPVVWFDAGTEHGSVDSVLAGLRTSAAAVLGRFDRPWRTVDDAASALASVARGTTLLVIDDFHAIEGTAADAVVEQLIAALEPNMHAIVLTRVIPAWNVSRLRAQGELLELGTDDLRFRSWEVEHLLADDYGAPLPPEDVAELTRRTEGWAAGLQLFRLATASKSVRDRRLVLRQLGARSGVTSDYLARNVLDELPGALDEFLLLSSSLPRLHGQLCDEFLSMAGADDLLRELHRRQIFVDRLNDDGWYRYHEVLSAHLTAALVDQLGDGPARLHHRRAAELLERRGLVADAMRVFCRAEAWEDVDRLLGRNAGRVLDGPGHWIDGLPPRLLEQDPWIMVAAARRELGAGNCASALARYRHAASLWAALGGDEPVAAERMALAACVDAAAPVPPGWGGLTLRATRKAPADIVDVALRLGDPGGDLAAGLAALLAGHLREARTHLSGVADAINAEDLAAAIATLALGLASAMAGDRSARDHLDHASEALDRLGWPWLAAIAQAASGVVDRSDRVVLAALDGLRSAGAWPDAEPAVIAAWRAAAEALGSALAGTGDAAVAQEAGTAAMSSGARGALALSLRAAALLGGDRSLATTALKLEDECGLAAPGPSAGVAPPSSAPIALRCFSAFAIMQGEEPVELPGVRPRAMAVLQRLACDAGRPVHREVLIEALWTDPDPGRAIHNLHVVVSSLRRALASAGVDLSITREGEGYVLHLPDGGDVDTARFARAVDEARAASSRDDTARAASAYDCALAAYAGDLLPEAGPCEWVVDARERYRTVAAEVAAELAALHVGTGDYSSALHVCERGLRIDRYCDRLWQLRIEASTARGNIAGAARARAAYADVLSELGVDVAS